MAGAFGIEITDRLVNGIGEIPTIGEGLVGQMVALQVTPYPLDGIELRSVLRQPLDGEPGRAGGQGGSCRLAGMDRAIVEDEPDRLAGPAGSRSVATVDLVEKGDEIGAALAIAGVDEQLPLGPVKSADQGDFEAWPGAGTRRSAPLLAQAWAR